MNGVFANPILDYSRDTVIKRIRTALRLRSGKAWSVTGGRGKTWGRITITAPPSRWVAGGMTDADRKELGSLLGKEPAYWRGVYIPASKDYYREYVDRAEGRTPVVYGKPSWD